MRSTGRRLRVGLCVGCVVWLAWGSLAWACPNCGEALASDPNHAGLVRGLFWSILFLLSMPFLILGGLGGYFYWLIRNAPRAAPESVGAGVSGNVPEHTADLQETVEHPSYS